MNQITRKDGKLYSLKFDKNRFFYPDEYMRFYDLLKAKQKHTASCLLNTGARINEIRNVMVNDIDFSNRRLILRVTKTKAKKKERIGRTRTIPISSQFSRYLKRYCNGRDAGSSIGILSTPAFDIGMKKAAEKANLSNPGDFSAHNIRKTLETWLVALGIDGLKITAHFGHDPRTAAYHYINPDIFSWEEKKKMRDIIGDLYG